MAPSIDVISPAPPVVAAKRAAAHPFAPLTAQEITASADLIRSQWPAGTDVHFKVITLQEPPKALVVPILEAEKSGETFTPPPRKSYVTYYLRNTVSRIGCRPNLRQELIRDYRINFTKPPSTCQSQR